MNKFMFFFEDLSYVWEEKDQLMGFTGQREVLMVKIRDAQALLVIFPKGFGRVRS